MWTMRNPKPMAKVEEALRAQSWHYTRAGDDTILTGARGQSGRTFMILIRDEAERKTLALHFCPSPATSGMSQPVGRTPVMCLHENGGYTRAQIAAVCETLMTENYRILLGRFERDEKDGEIRFGIALPYRDTTLSTDQVTWCIGIAISTLEGIMPKIEQCLRAAERQMVV